MVECLVSVTDTISKQKLIDVLLSGVSTFYTWTSLLSFVSKFDVNTYFGGCVQSEAATAVAAAAAEKKYGGNKIMYVAVRCPHTNDIRIVCSLSMRLAP